MTSSTLDMTGEATPVTGLGHGTRALGPSDSSDSGSDMMGGPGMDEGLNDEQSREMPQTIYSTAGRDVGDGDLDSDTDRFGTGERGASGVDASTPNDTLATIKPGIESGADELDDPDATGTVGNIPTDDEEDDDQADAGDRSMDDDGDDDKKMDDGAT